jgi:hypothetical protein
MACFHKDAADGSAEPYAYSFVLPMIAGRRQNDRLAQ